MCRTRWLFSTARCSGLLKDLFNRWIDAGPNFSFPVCSLSSSPSMPSGWIFSFALRSKTSTFSARPLFAAMCKGEFPPRSTSLKFTCLWHTVKETIDIFIRRGSLLGEKILQRCWSFACSSEMNRTSFIMIKKIEFRHELKKLFEIFRIGIDCGTMNRTDLNENLTRRRQVWDEANALPYLIVRSRLFQHADRSIDGDVFFIVEQNLENSDHSSFGHHRRLQQTWWWR